MKITETVSFWLFIFIIVTSCLVGAYTHWIIGAVLFVLLVAKTALITVIIDTFTAGLKYHHDRQDMRAKKTIASLMLLRSSKHKPNITHLTKF